MKKRFSLFGLLLCLAQAPAHAQALHAGISPEGIVLHYDGPMDAPVQLFKNGKELGTLQVERDESRIREGLQKAYARFPGYPQIADSLQKYLFQSLREATNTEKLYGKYYLPVKLALKLAWLDGSGKVSDVYTATRNGSPLEVQWDRKGPSFQEPALIPGKYKSWFGDIESLWNINPKNQLLYTRLYRKNVDSSRFEPIKNVAFTMNRKGDTLRVVARDTLVPRLSYYQYAMVGYDFYGNATQPSAPMLVDNLDYSTMPVVLNFSAKENEARNRIEIRWQLKFSDRVKSLLLQRSFNSDKGFETITALGPNDSLYIDEVSHPMEAVYYKLLIYDLKGLLPRTPVVPMVSHSKPDVMPPSLVEVQWDEGAPELRWIISDRSARGFRVYRTEAIGKAPVLVSSFVDADASWEYRWRDTSRFLEPGKTYHYSITGQGKGYTESAYSMFAGLQIPDSRKPSAPQGLNGRFLNDRVVFLAWNTEVPIPGAARVFRVYRSDKREGPYTRLGKEPVSGMNAITDTLPTYRDSVFYRVSAINASGLEGEPGLPYMVRPKALRSGVNFLLAKRQAKGMQLQWALSPEVAAVELYTLSAEGKEVLLSKVSAPEFTFIDTQWNPETGRPYRSVTIFKDGTRSEPGVWTQTAAE